ncbi:hypothetical protein LZC95_43755 [Pendulispora brunnea]|uniref:Lipoprotein n=1 Tax=Pendulispora brunnea TaxID=2905690 RepID=A0ABZ2K3U1_9BACT
MMPRAPAIAVLAVLLACNGKQRLDAPFIYKDAGPPPANREEPEQRVDPSPMTDTCSAACAQVDVAGAVVELPAPYDDSAGYSSVTFGRGHWYVAWGGGQAMVTQMQRFTVDGQPVGRTRRLERTAPGQLVWNPAGQGELDLYGAWSPAQDAMGDAAWLRFDPNLVPLEGAFRIQEVRSLRYGDDRLEIQGARLERTSSLDRIRPMLRLHRLDPAGGAMQNIEQYDWYAPSTSRWLAVERFGDKRFVAYVADGAVQVAELGPNGALGIPSRALEGLPDNNFVIVRSVKVGNDWWVGAFIRPQTAQTVQTVLLRKIDPATLAVLDEPIRIQWPTGYPTELLDANGTLALGGSLEGRSSPLRWSFVPIDTQARAVCRPSTVVMTRDQSAHQTIRAAHFEGDTAGVTLDTWAGSGPRRVYFTRLACTRPAP